MGIKSTLGATFNAIESVVTETGNALTSVAKAANHTATMAEEAAYQALAEQRVENSASLKELEAKLKDLAV